MRLKFERIAIHVDDLDAAVKHFSELFETTFEKRPEALNEGIRTGALEFEKIIQPDHPNPAFEQATLTAAISPDGIELTRREPLPEKLGLRNITWRVDDLEQAKAAMKEKGFPMLVEYKMPHWGEAVFDVYGIRWVITAFEDATIWEARLRK